MSLRDHGAVVNTAIAISCAEVIVKTRLAIFLPLFSVT